MNDHMTLSAVLDGLAAVYDKYVVFPNEHCAAINALWVAHTWRSMDFYTTPRLVFQSATPASGKTRALEITALVSFNARMTISSSTAALFRRIGHAHHSQETPPTICFDETDAVFGGSRPSEQTEQLRGLMNSGYKHGATVDRCEGDASEMKVIEWPVFAPLAMAGLSGNLPDTITTRAIVIEMKKRTSKERVQPYRERSVKAEVQPLVSALAQWAQDDAYSLAGVYPNVPKGVEDRAAEVWEPLIAIADQAGGQWPKRAREACTAFVFKPRSSTPPLAIELLSDIREVMGHGADAEYRTVEKIRTTELLEKLRAIDESPWGELDAGRGLTSRKLSRLLAAYDVRPIPFKDSLGIVAKGYQVAGNARQAGLADAWDRYLSPPEPTAPGTPSPGAVTTVTTVTPQVDASQSVTDGNPVTVTANPVTDSNNPMTSKVTAVTEVTDFQRMGTRRAVLNSLSPDVPSNLGAIMRQVKEATGDGTTTGDELDQLEKEGTVHRDAKGHYLLNKKQSA
ncbi:DUF3631 domain-containing protein [Corynebacterium flavescens]|uniref:DUF3631 domain-containing protein n=1 Tax=Corynebacterium flavescens TaxID=28028 RepID=UPI0028987FDB|nr:DUF3631 domain-containing protein [Corynebacterium flavescens]